MSAIVLVSVYVSASLPDPALSLLRERFLLHHETKSWLYLALKTLQVQCIDLDPTSIRDVASILEWLSWHLASKKDRHLYKQIQYCMCTCIHLVVQNVAECNGVYVSCILQHKYKNNDDFKAISISKQTYSDNPHMISYQRSTNCTYLKPKGMHFLSYVYTHTCTASSPSPQFIVIQGIPHTSTH